MEFMNVIKFEVLKGKKNIVIFAGAVSLLLLAMVQVFDPTLFANYNTIMEGMPEAALQLLGGLVDLSTFNGYFTMYILEFSWMWYGIYLILKVAQDIPSDMEGKTIDLVLSKPIRRWEYVIGKQISHIIMIIVVVGSSLLISIGAAAMNSKISFENLDIGGLSIVFLWLGLLLIAIESVVLLISTILGNKKAITVGFIAIIGLWFIASYSNSIPVENIENISMFHYFNPRIIMLSGSMEGVLLDMMILIAFSIVFSLIAVIYFNKKDIPV